MLVYMACLLVLLSVISVSIWRLWSAQLVLNERANDLVKILNVGEQWRDDVRQAPPFALRADGQGISLTHNGRQCEYLMENGELRRTIDGQTEVLARNILSSQMQLNQKDGLAYGRWEVTVRMGHTGNKSQAFTFMAVPTQQKGKQ